MFRVLSSLWCGLPSPSFADSTLEVEAAVRSGGAVQPAVTTGGGTLTVETVTSERGFDELEPAWTALYEAGGTSPFQAFAWQRAWWRHYDGQDDPAKRLEILVVRDGGTVIAIAPFFVERLRAVAVLPVTRMALIGRERSDYLDLLIDERSAAAGLAALAKHVRRRRNRFDVLVMEDVPDHSRWLEMWLEALRAQGLQCVRVLSDQCPRIHLGQTWQETEANLPPATRGKMRRRMRHLTERHGAQLEIAGGPESLDGDLAELMELHQQRWTAVGQPGVFSDPRFTHLVQDAARGMAARNQLMLAFLRVDGRRVAGICGFRHRDEFHFFHGGLGDAGEAARYSPGIALHLMAMKALLETGVRTYDLLRGTEPYKADLGGVPNLTWRVTVAGRPGRLGRWPYLVHQGQRRARIRIEHERRLLDALRGDPDKGARDVRRHLARRLRANVRDAVVRGRRR